MPESNLDLRFGYIFMAIRHLACCIGVFGDKRNRFQDHFASPCTARPCRPLDLSSAPIAAPDLPERHNPAAAVAIDQHGRAKTSMPRIEIAHLVISEIAADKLWTHGLTARQVRAVLAGRTIVRRNRAGRAAPYVLLGYDEQGRCLAIPIAPSDDPLIWRVITGWYCKPGEATVVQRGGRIMDHGHQYDAIAEPHDDEERALMDPDTWDWSTPIEVVVAEDVGVQMPISITFEEYGLLERGARAVGLSPHAYMKRVALAAAQARELEDESMADSRNVSARKSA